MPEAFKFVVYFLVCCDHAFVLTGLHRNNKNSIECVHVCNEIECFFSSYDSSENLPVKSL